MKISGFFKTFALAACLLLPLAPRAQGAAGDLDLSFDPGSGINGAVNAVVVQPDGKVIIGGQFTTVKGLARTNLARLNADGSGDSSFNAAAPGYPVGSLALQPDGKVLVGGNVSDNYGLTRLNPNGTPDTHFNTNVYQAIAATEPYFHYDVVAIAVQADGKILFGGLSLLRLHSDGTLDPSFQEAVPGSVLSIALQTDGKMILAGNFYQEYGTHPTSGVVRIHADGSLDAGFAVLMEGGAFVVALQADGKVLLGGQSLTIDGVGGYPISMARLNANGTLDPSFAPWPGVGSMAIPVAVSAIGLQADGKVVIGGKFATTDGGARANLARLNPDGTLDPGYANGAGGAADLSAVSSLAAVNAVVVRPDGSAFISGGFTTVNGTNRNPLARLLADGSMDAGFQPGRGVGSGVSALLVQADGKVVIGGRASGIQRLEANGRRDESFVRGTGPNARVSCLARQADGKLLVGWAVNGTDTQPLGRFHADGSVDPTFSPALAGLGLEPIPPQWGGSHGTAVSAIRVLADGRILVAGYGATEISSGDSLGQYFNFFLELLNADGSHAAGFNTAIGEASGSYFFGWLAAPPAAIIIQPDGRILIGGTFTRIGGISRSGIARLHADGTLDASFVPGTVGIDSAHVSALSLQPDGKVLAGGSYFGLVNGVGRRGIVRFNPNGSLDSSFATGAGTNAFSSSVNALALQPDGKVIIGGDFTTFNGTNRNRIARLNTDGSLDGGFNPGADGRVGSLALRPDGGVLIGGDFLTVNGVISPHLALLRGDPPASFAAWMGRYGYSGANIAEDPDRDGLANSLEFVLGGHPGIAAPVERPLAAIVHDKLVFTFSRDDLSETPDLTLTVEAGTDLLTWPTVFTIGPDTASSSPGVSVVENAGGADTITVFIPRGTNPARFARMKVMVAP